MGGSPLRMAATAALIAVPLAAAVSATGMHASRAFAGEAPGDAKSVVPTLSKEVSLDGHEWGDRADAPAGADLFYRVTATLPGYTDVYDRYPYAFVDTHEPSVMVDTDSIRVELLSGDESTDVTQSFTVASQGNVIRVSVDDLKATFPDLSGDNRFRMSYKARLSGTPDLGIANPNENACHLEYMTDVLAEKEPGTYGSGEMDKTPDEVTFVYSYGIEIAKSSAADASPLAGATFTVADEDGRPLVDGGWGQPGSAAREFVTDGGGKALVQGIGTGELTLTETRAPEGYVAVQPVRISLSRGAASDGKTELQVQVDGATMDGCDAPTGILRVKIEDPPSDSENDLVNRAAALLQTGAGLPLAFIVLGGAGVVAFVVTGRRRKTRDG